MFVFFLSLGKVNLEVKVILFEYDFLVVLKSGLHSSSIVITACFNTFILLFVVVRFVFQYLFSGIWLNSNFGPRVTRNIIKCCRLSCKVDVSNVLLLIYEPCREKIGFRGFRPGPTRTILYNHTRWLEA